MKIQKISNYAISTVKKVSKVFSKQNVSIETVLPYTSLPLVAYYLQNEDEAIQKLIKDSVERKYISLNQTNNINHITELENKGIIDPQKPWEAPPFDNGILTDTKYNDIVKHIKESTSLSDTQKQEHLQRLANDNYKSYEPSFQQAPESSDYSVYNGDNDDGCCDCGSDDDCCDSDSDCDSGDAAVSSC